jgi:hypothetical protein
VTDGETNVIIQLEKQLIPFIMKISMVCQIVVRRPPDVWTRLEPSKWHCIPYMTLLKLDLFFLPEI